MQRREPALRRLIWGNALARSSSCLRFTPAAAPVGQDRPGPVFLSIIRAPQIQNAQLRMPLRRPGLGACASN
jgi:hypothetical protein